MSSGLVGLSRVLTRRWLVGGNFTLTHETGYLTEPYKVVSLIDPTTDLRPGSSSEGRPSTRDRRAALTSAVYHQDANVLYLEYRYYWDDWRVRSHTIDGRYLITLPAGTHVTPHLAVLADAAEFHVPSSNRDAPSPSSRARTTGSGR